MRISLIQEATKPENRAKRPWIITMGHRPMYCTNSDDDSCALTDGYMLVRLILHRLNNLPWYRFASVFHSFNPLVWNNYSRNMVLI